MNFLFYAMFLLLGWAPDFASFYRADAIGAKRAISSLPASTAAAVWRGLAASGQNAINI